MVGTRSTQRIHPLSMKLFEYTAIWMAEQGHIIRSGGAQGTDQRVLTMAARHGGQVEVILPWNGYEYDWVERFVASFGCLVTTITLDVRKHADWMCSVDTYHPAAARLSWAERKIHARNFGIITDTAAVFALPQPPERGGTAQGMRAARGLGIPVFNIAVPGGPEQLSRWLDRNRTADAL